MTSLVRHTALPCGWCGTSNTDPSRTNCANCGGPLPPSTALAIDDPGPRPPAAPRDIPVAYRRQVMLWKNVLVLIGALFSIVFCWTLIFPLIGIPMWIIGHRRAQAKLSALQRGVAGQAELVDVSRDTSVQINGRNPWRLDYTFVDAQGGVHAGWAHAWQASHSRRTPGEAFWVVYMADDPEQNAVWPPIR